MSESDCSEFSAIDGHFTDRFLAGAIPFFKLFIFLPGKVMRLVFQIGDFYYLIQILSITLEFTSILFTSGSRLSTTLLVIYIFISFLFTILFGNIFTIPLWELFQLRWLRNKNPFQTIFDILHSIKSSPNYNNDKVFIIEKIINFICGILCYVYISLLVSYMNGKGEGFDKMNGFVLLILPGIKFFLIYILYLIKAFLTFFEFQIENNLISANEDPSYGDDNNNNSDPQQDIEQPNDQDMPNNNNDQITDPFIISMITNSEMRSNAKIKFFFVYKIVILIIELVFLLKICIHYHFSGWGFVLSLVIYLYVGLFSIFTSMPIWFFNLLQQWDYLNIIKSREGKNVEIRKSRKHKGFKYISFIGQALPFLVMIVLIVIYILDYNKTGKHFKKIEDDVHWDGRISGKFPYVPSITSVKSAMCYSQIYGLNLMQIASIAAAPYYSDLDYFTKLLYNSFFRDTNYNINMKFLSNEDNNAVLLQADFDTDNPDDALTIFSVRGSQTGLDWWLDFEIYVASAMLTVAKWIPFLQRQEGSAAKMITGFMTLPLSTMMKATMTYRYTNKMFHHIDNFLENESNINRSVLFTGHSLGGGLSKVLACKYEIQSVAVSGPGITPIENKFSNKDNYDKYFKSKLIDIVPDRDIVPRLEVSGGTRHRVLCKKSLGQCHDKLRTLCQMGVSCNDEYHAGDFCSNAFKDDYEQMKKLAHL